LRPQAQRRAATPSQGRRQAPVPHGDLNYRTFSDSTRSYLCRV
jgi:hypothetical protein